MKHVYILRIDDDDIGGIIGVFASKSIAWEWLAAQPVTCHYIGQANRHNVIVGDTYVTTCDSIDAAIAESERVKTYFRVEKHQVQTSA